MKKTIIIILSIFLLMACNKETKPIEIPIDSNKEIKPIETPTDSNDLTKLDNYIFKEITSVNETITQKVLIIEIDPILTKGIINGTICKDKHASECLNQNKKQSIDETINDIEYSSHNYINIEIVKTETLNEFPKYKKEIKLLNNKTSYKLDEDTWLDIFENGWYNGISDKRIDDIENYSFDYDYLIDKYDLINRKNNNEFDEVWLVNIDPTKNYESIMVGKNSFWINGLQIEKECKPFRIMNISISRPDANYECFGHATEQLLDKVFSKINYRGYNALNWNKDSVTITKDNYNRLSDWQKFMLTDNQNTIKNSGYAGVGNMHYSPNSVQDYDWENKTNVKSKYNEWNYYPNITNNPSEELFNSDIYLKERINGTNSSGRLHHRWWFSLLPHSTGYNSSGYSNNWWSYIYKNSYVTKITTEQTTYKYNINNKIDNINLTLNYLDESKEIINLTYDNNVEIDNKSIFSIDKNNYLYATSKGESNIKYYRDGVYIELNIIIE